MRAARVTFVPDSSVATAPKSPVIATRETVGVVVAGGQQAGAPSWQIYTVASDT